MSVLLLRAKRGTLAQQPWFLLAEMQVGVFIRENSCVLLAKKLFSDGGNVGYFYWWKFWFVLTKIFVFLLYRYTELEAGAGSGRCFKGIVSQEKVVFKPALLEPVFLAGSRASFFTRLRLLAPAPDLWYTVYYILAEKKFQLHEQSQEKIEI